AGRPLVLCFLAGEPPAWESIAVAFRDLHRDFQQAGAGVACVAVAPVESCTRVSTQFALPFPLLADLDGEVTRAHGVRPDATGPRTFITDTNFRIAWICDQPSATAHADEVLEFVRGVAGRETPRHVTAQAPVLMIPNVLSPDFCQELIRIWETQGNEDSGFMVQREARTVGVLAYGHKIRRDHYLDEREVKKRVMFSIFHRVRPEILKAFHFEVTRAEDYRIVCYDAGRGGYFRPHRDNTTPGTAHRVFAMTLNLNAGEYEGGYLRFPEDGPHLYRPRTGEAVGVSPCAPRRGAGAGAGGAGRAPV